MLRLTGEQVCCICNDWHGNKGELSLWGLCVKYGLTVNQVYSVLSATGYQNTDTLRRRTGVRIHSYDEDYGRKA